MSATSQKMPLDLVRERAGAFEGSVRERWSEEQLAAIWQSVAPTASFGEFLMFATQAATLDLNPFAHEIWFTKSDNGKVMIMVGRDGLLKVARRSPDFHSVLGDVHRENDDFSVAHAEDGTTTVEHRYRGTVKDRGEIVGSWAQLRRKDGSRTNFEYCPIGEYAPTSNSKYSPWNNQRSVMMTKCSISLALRIGYGVTGVVGEDEVSGMLEDQRNPRAPELSAIDGTGTLAEPLPDLVLGVVDRAKRLGHAALSNPDVVRIAVGGQPEPVWREWVARNALELDRLETSRAASPTVSAPSVVEADVSPVEHVDSAEELPPGMGIGEEEAERVVSEYRASPLSTSEKPKREKKFAPGSSKQPVETAVEAPATSPIPSGLDPNDPDYQSADVLRKRLDKLRKRYEAISDPAARELIAEEAEDIKATLLAMAAADENQESLL